MNENEVAVGCRVNVKFGRNIIQAEVLEILGDGKFRMRSAGSDREFIAPLGRLIPVAEESEDVNPAEEQTTEAEPESIPEELEDEENEVIPAQEQEDDDDDDTPNPAPESGKPDLPEKPRSLLNAAIEVLKRLPEGTALNTRELVKQAIEQHLWEPTGCKTPEQTLYGSIFREMKTKEQPRIVKAEEKGKFRIA